MNKLLFLFLLTLSACSTVRPSSRLYSCDIFNLHGSYVHIKGSWPSIEAARLSALQVVHNLGDKLPNDVNVKCSCIGGDPETVFLQ